MEGDILGSRNGCCGRDRQRGCRDAMLVQFIQRGGRGDRRTLQTERRKQKGEEEKRGSEGVDRRGKGRLTLRPCRMHKARTRQETLKEMISKTDTSKRAHKGEEKS